MMAKTKARRPKFRVEFMDILPDDIPAPLPHTEEELIRLARSREKKKVAHRIFYAKHQDEIVNTTSRRHIQSCRIEHNGRIYAVAKPPGVSQSQIRAGV